LQLHLEQAVSEFRASRKRILVLGYNATLTTAVEAPRQPKKHFDQIQALTKVNPAAYSCLTALAGDPSVDIIIFSGSEKERLAEVFENLPVWLAAENGVVLRPPDSQDWHTIMESSGGEWKDSVQLVFEYFCERTPRSFVEQRGTSLVWNYKYADVEFGRIQARDLLQHLLTGPISNAPVDIVRGSRSIEVRPVGVSKGSSMERILQFMSAFRDLSDVDFVLVAGHFLARDENVFTLFEGQRSLVPAVSTEDGRDIMGESWQQGPTISMLEAELGGPETATAPLGSLEVKRDGAESGALMRTEVAKKEGSRRGGGVKVTAELPFPLPPKHLFTCTVGRSMASKAK